MKLQLGIVSLMSLPFWLGVLGGQMHKHQGLWGGTLTASDVVVQREVLKPVRARTPGKLRVVENSGICG